MAIEQLSLPVPILIRRRGKDAGEYLATVSIEDVDLAGLKWRLSGRLEWTFYALGKFMGKDSYLHRIVLGRKLDRDLLAHEHVDHIDGNGLNNQRSNLRVATVSQNAMNKNLRSDNTSGHVGVGWHNPTKKWRAVIKKDGIRRQIGAYENIEDAIAARKKAEKEIFGKYRNVRK